MYLSIYFDQLGFALISPIWQRKGIHTLELQAHMCRHADKRAMDTDGSSLHTTLVALVLQTPDWCAQHHSRRLGHKRHPNTYCQGRALRPLLATELRHCSYQTKGWLKSLSIVTKTWQKIEITNKIYKMNRLRCDSEWPFFRHVCQLHSTILRTPTAFSPAGVTHIQVCLYMCDLYMWDWTLKLKRTK